MSAELYSEFGWRLIDEINYSLKHFFKQEAYWVISEEPSRSLRHTFKREGYYFDAEESPKVHLHALKILSPNVREKLAVQMAVGHSPYTVTVTAWPVPHRVHAIAHRFVKLQRLAAPQGTSIEHDSQNDPECTCQTCRFQLLEVLRDALLEHGIIEEHEEVMRADGTIDALKQEPIYQEDRYNIDLRRKAQEWAKHHVG